jgi:hypothetical protein
MAFSTNNIIELGTASALTRGWNGRYRQEGIVRPTWYYC